MENATPMLRQYLEIKKQYPGTILFFRLGDFYEMFNEDALIGSRELEITLTARQKDSKNPIPMCGVPYHAAANYISRLVRKGYRVAICEQAENAGKGIKLVRREVVRVITPGTAVDAQLTEPNRRACLAAIIRDRDTFGVSFLDLASGDFEAMQASGTDAWKTIRDLIETYDVKEIIFPDSSRQPIEMDFGSGLPVNSLPLSTDEAEIRAVSDQPTLTPLGDDVFDTRAAEDFLKQHFRIADLSAFGLNNKSEAVRAAALCLNYVKETQKAFAGHISAIRIIEQSDHLILDPVTIRNLEILGSRGENEGRTLFSVLNETVTTMGARLLRSWLQRPLMKRSEIQTRLTAVSELTDSILRLGLRHLLKRSADLERLTGRLHLALVSPRDLVSLRDTLELAPKIHSVMGDASSLLLQVISENVFELPETVELISKAIVDDPPNNLSDGGVIRPGHDEELDELRSISNSGKQTIASFEQAERERTGISNLKVRFNNVFGYYIEISKSNVSRVPDDYERRQTLTNAERYTTPQLKEWEKKVLGAESRIAELETELFNTVRGHVRAETQKLQSTARALATLDVLAALAEAATKRNYVAPVLSDVSDEIEIKSGRHAVVEAFSLDDFIPNDCYLNNSTDRLLIVTGANMGGKSTVLRQIALIQVMAQIGSFVPATAARLPIVDRIWTRVGASDDLASGRSTFMVEMTETAAILNNATPRSLVLLDEIGRGTSTFDGLAIAWAVAEYIHDSPEHSAKTIFATHYHELTELADRLPGAKNYQITATERDGEVVFLHKLQKGKASKSYGIAVARLAGLPQRVIERAKDVLKRLEQYELAVFQDSQRAAVANGSESPAQGGDRPRFTQFSLFDLPVEQVVAELRERDLNSLSANEAIRLLRDYQERIK